MSGIKSGTGNMEDLDGLSINTIELKNMMDEAIKAHLCEESPLTTNNFRTLEANNDVYGLGYGWQTIGIEPPTETLDETIKRIVEEEINKAMKNAPKTTSKAYGIEKYHMKHK